MSETLPRSATPNKITVETPTAEELHLMVNRDAPTPRDVFGNGRPNQEELSVTPELSVGTTQETDDTRETSRSAGILRRVANFLEQRAVNKAHSAALKEYRSNYNEDYTDHVSTLADSDNESYQEVGQTLLDREHRREDRAEFIDKARTFARNTGEAALGAARTTGEVALGLGVIAGEKVYNGAKAASEVVTDKVKNTVEMGVQGVYDYSEAAKDTYRNTKGNLQDQYAETKASVQNTIDMGLQTAYDYTEAAKDAYRNTKGELQDRYTNTKEALKSKLGELAAAARDRRDKRRAKWAARKQSAIDTLTSLKDTSIDIATTAIGAGQEVIATARQEGQRVIGETSSRINTARAAGSAALEAYAATAQAHKEQNKL